MRVTTTAEFDALPHGSVVRRDADPSVPWDEPVVAERSTESCPVGWFVAGHGGVRPTSSLVNDGMPYTVLYRPDD